MEWKRNTVKKGDKGYEIRVSPDLWFDENDPVVLRKEKEAIESLTKCPIPEWVLNRTLDKKPTP